MIAVAAVAVAAIEIALHWLLGNREHPCAFLSV
jgi:hypothetical protein